MSTASVILRSPQSRSATLQACERPRLPPGRLIPIIGVVTEIKAVEITEVGVALLDDPLDAAPDQFFRRRDADLLGLVKGDEDGGVDKAARVAVGPLGAGAEVVVAPAPLGCFVAGQAVVLAADQLLDSGLPGSVMRQAAVHAHQRLDAVGVGPDVVNQHRIVAADQGQLAEQEFLAPFDRTPNRGRVEPACSRSR